MSEQLGVVNTVGVFKSVVENPVTRAVLSRLSAYCQKDGDSRLAVALDLFVGSRQRACLSCRMALKVLVPILSFASKAFGSSNKQLKEQFRDHYWRRGLVSVIKGITWFGVRRPFVPGAPFQVVWGITKACNLKCKHCYESAGIRAKDELTTQEALKGIDILADAGVLILAFSGGEPTVRPDILRLIRHASNRGMYVAMATNAILLANLERVSEYKRAGLQFVQISLDGMNPKTHDSFRGVPGAFDKTIQGIKNCVAEELFVEVATTGTRFNQREIPQLVDFVDELGVDWFMLYNFVPTGRGAEIVEADLTPEQREEMLKVLWHKMKTKRIQVLSTAPQFARIAQETEAAAKAIVRRLQAEDSEHEDIMHLRGLTQQGKQSNLRSNSYSGECYQDIVPTHFYNPNLSGNLKRLADFIGGCGAGRFYMSIEPNGDMYPCVFFPHEEPLKIGNLLRDDFESLWRSSKLLWTLRNKDLLKPSCHSCEYRYTCGGCRARAYNYYKDILAPDPGCIKNKRHWIALEKELKENLETEKTPISDVILEGAVR